MASLPINPFLQHDALQVTARDAVPGWFDRFYFNAHRGATGPCLLMGAGVYPVEGVVDGYVIAVANDAQVNLRVSDVHPGSASACAVGPLSWEILKPMQRWRVRLAPNPSRIAFDLTWSAASSFWPCAPMHLDDGRGRTAAFDHGFQSGRHEGWIEIEGERFDVSGWSGQRDRSRGTRLPGARQGVHMWIQAQFEDACIGCNLDLDRGNRPTLLDGAWMGRDGSLDPIERVEHDLVFDDDLELLRARFQIRTASGREFGMDADLTATRGGYMAGGGYGGWHGQARGANVIEHERWSLAEKARLRSLSTPLTDRLARFTRRDGGTAPAVEGAGVFEFAHSRSPEFRYAASLR
ncbi:hypothetical protein PE066_05940 [Ramlibacter tataouinensis]|uniref:hypothetical protein n=1 Tax=Ramlibacter tataouinensis TaxID=94132 RepID=UPI0022F3DD9D|nr:hypothetical protein [Ramlibacter tataouinensis]WBY03077.1 hypothetical protein PE066_05940 [Ramlibacter tataouinensis]